MITVLMSLGQVVGADVGLLGWVVCAAVYFAAVLCVPANRTGGGLHRVWSYFLLSELVVDFAWYLIFYVPDGYQNYGLAGVAPLLLWPVALLVAGRTASAKNRLER